MAWWAMLLGSALIALVLLDVFWTTLWVEGGAGPLASRLIAWTWRGWRRLVGEDRHRALSLAGPLALILVTQAWAAMLWGGWALVFAADEGALTSASHARPFGWSDRLYFAGYTVFTLGIGDFTPARGGWQLLTVLAVASGLVVATLAVTYLLSLVSAVVQARSLAGQVAGLGASAEDLVLLGWDGEGFGALELPFHAIATQLGAITHQHQAYPALHYYHASSARNAHVLAVAAFDEALTLLTHGVQESVRPAAAVLRPARSAVDSFLKTLKAGSAAAETPPPPDLARLRAAGIPTVSDEAFAAALQAEAERRRALSRMLRSDARSWPADMAAG